MRVLVTGAAGFVGSHLAEALAADGHDVTCLLRPNSNPRWLANSSLSFVDCGMDSPKAMAGPVGNSDMIFHVAGVTKASTPQGYFNGNVNITRNLVKAVKTHGHRVKAVIGVSSQAAAGPHPGPEGLDEIATPAPVSYYGKAKLQSEQALMELADLTAVGIVRPSMVYGPRDYAFLPLYSGARLGLFPVPGSRKTLMSIIHVNDLVRGIVSLGNSLLDGDVDSGNVYFLSGQTASWSGIGKAIGDVVGRGQMLFPIPLFAIGAVAMVNGVLARLGLPTNHLLPDKWREAKQSGWVCTHGRANADFGYSPQISLEEGMRGTIQWCRENGLL
ncbi:NAD-dependent epimerase/dehydratase family protein [Pseudodesulfovibrio methanolicus]|uniref:NAD(P)-dependent oxidoreductase n=1 Tax=Pseudodesulfovibrio methanolicus TaxID=3126690 RepID=A0ABZ2IUA6_9BACT